MILKTIIDLLAEEDQNLPKNDLLNYIDDTFIYPSDKVSDLRSEAQLSTKRKLRILDWVSIDRQLRSYGSSMISDLCLGFINEDAKRHIIRSENQESASTVVIDFSSDAIPFAVKYNVAMALSYSEAIGILSRLQSCEIYASEEVKRIFRKNGKNIHPGLNRISFNELPLEMQKDLIWPMVQNLYRGMTIRKAAQVFPEGVPGKLAYEALVSECENKQLASRLSHLDALKYSDYETIYFTDLSDLEVKYRVALYCLNHVGEIKPRQSSPSESSQEDEAKQHEDEQQHSERIKTIEEEYISAFKRLNKNKSFWDKINLNDISQMGKDVIAAIKEEIRDFAQLKQEIISRLFGHSKVTIENQELLRIVNNQNPNFEFASEYLSMFFHPSDYYSILGLDTTQTVTVEDVKTAFKKQAKIYHPDKNTKDPKKAEKEKRFKLLMEAKNALLRRLMSGKEDKSSFRSDALVINYLGSISKLFAEYSGKDQDLNSRKEDSRSAENLYLHQDRRETNLESNASQPDNTNVPYQGEAESAQDILKEGVEMVSDEDIINDSTNKNYLGPYFEEMRILESMIDGWAGKKVLVIGAGREPDDFSIPVILSKMGAEISAVDVNYRGPSEYKGCQYYRVSADRIDRVFEEEQFDVVISTAMFGVPFTNWAARTYSLRFTDQDFKTRIMELELDVLGRLHKLTKKGGIHFHYNRDLNPQSWNFTEEDIKRIGYESAFHPKELPNPRETWFLKK